MPDLTLAAMKTQTQAMGAELFEVGVLLPSEPPQMLLRTWEKADIEKSLPWLKAKNREGAAIYIRPKGEHQLSLIDDLKPDRLPDLKKEGFHPCLVVQTSPGNYQAWLDHGRILPKDVATAAARALAERFDGDLGSADWRHFGRLSGFTNRKEKYRMEDGRFPFVRLVEANPGLIYEQAKPFINGVERALEKKMIDAARVAARARVLEDKAGTRGSGRIKSIQDFHSDSRYAGDLSRADLAYTIYALGHGVPDNAIRSALTARDLSKKGAAARIEDYVNRTLLKAAEQIQQPSFPGIDRVRERSR